jgi:hypothetical protein
MPPPILLLLIISSVVAADIELPPWYKPIGDGWCPFLFGDSQVPANVSRVPSPRGDESLTLSITSQDGSVTRKISSNPSIDECLLQRLLKK